MGFHSLFTWGRGLLGVTIPTHRIYGFPTHRTRRILKGYIGLITD